MDIQKIIAEAVSKLKANPDLLKSFASDPAKLLKDTLGIDIPEDQIESVISGIKEKIDIPGADGLLDKIKNIFGK